MKLVINGPRSVGKTTLSKVLSKKLNLTYIEFDKEMDKALEDLGGLHQALKEDQIEETMKRTNIVLKEILAKDNIVLDLAGGATGRREYAEENRTILKDSEVILLLPNRHEATAIKTLQDREIKRDHFLSLQDSGHLTERQIKLRLRTHYTKNLPFWKEFANHIVYSDNRTPEAIAEEIISLVKF